MEFWMDDIYTPGYDGLLRRKEADLRRAKYCKLVALLAIAVIIILIIVIPICTMATWMLYRKPYICLFLFQFINYSVLAAMYRTQELAHISHENYWTRDNDVQSTLETTEGFRPTSQSHKLLSHVSYTVSRKNLGFHFLFLISCNTSC